MKSILLSAYAISPTKGSEFSVGWNYAIELAKNNKVYLICGVSGDHIGDTEEIENYFRYNPIENINLIVIRPTKLINALNYFNKIGITPVFYIAFRLWQKEAYQEAKKIIKNQQIDIVHHYNPIGFREPGYLWKLDKPFVWGPIGGASFVNSVLLKNKPIKVILFFMLKNFATYLQLNFSTKVKKAAQKAKILIFCNTENKKNFEKFVGKSGLVISEQAVPEINSDTKKSIDISSNIFKIIHIVRLDHNKNTKFLLEALSEVNSKNWQLDVIGDGHLKNELIDFSKKLEIDNNIVWHGFKSRNEIFQLIKKSDIHALASLSDANTTVLYETRLFGVPTISLDQNGMHDTLADGNGILVSVTSYDETKIEYAKKIEELIYNKDILKKLKLKTIALAKESTWSEKVKIYEKIYEDILEIK